MTSEPGAPRLRESGRIFLRALSRADVPAWHAWFNSAEVTEHLNKGVFPVTAEAQVAYLESLSNSRSDVQLGIATKDTGELIGIIGIHKIDWLHRRGDISIVIGSKAHWGKGLAAEAIGLMVEHAFEKLNLHKVTAGMWSSNMGSMRSFEKNGFALEGTLRENFFYKTGYVDELRLGLLRWDWEARRRGDAG